MKTLFLSLVLVSISLVSFSQDEKYNAAMKSALTLMEKARTHDSMQLAINQFDRIANAEKTKWLPLYYQAMCYISMSTTMKDGTKIDQILDKADEVIQKALNIEPNESELFVLQAWAYSARISVDPMGRGAQYSMKSNGELEKAKKINPNNPRVYFLQGSNIFYTPEFFGGGKAKAKPVFEMAKQKFEAYKKPSYFSPDWGKKPNDDMLALCNK